ncbi:MAG TPA: DOPA 4,5-dioxygenase family protein [Burkholderiales bacterium]|nr:DOPA 4,5-dioxygenase family protein [Burkholderiales bacterium]
MNDASNDASEVRRPRNIHARYHAHVYFDERSTEQARALCQAAADRFGVQMGRVHQRLVGPHPHWSCQITFDSAQFDALVPWLEGHREGLNILVHADTGNHLEDHTTHASWLGEPAELDLSHFKNVAK